MLSSVTKETDLDKFPLRQTLIYNSVADIDPGLLD